MHYLIRDPHDLRWRVLMLELRALDELALFLVEHYDLDLVCGVLDERAHGKSDVLLWLVAEIYRVYRPLPFVGVDLLLFWQVT